MCKVIYTLQDCGPFRVATVRGAFPYIKVMGDVYYVAISVTFIRDDTPRRGTDKFIVTGGLISDMARRTETWADLDSGHRFHPPTEEPDSDPRDRPEPCPEPP